jgi:hypothetical protein
VKLLAAGSKTKRPEAVEARPSHRRQDSKLGSPRDNKRQSEADISQCADANARCNEIVLGAEEAEVEVVDLIREVPRNPDESPNGAPPDYAGAAQAASRRSRQESNRRILPQYDVIQPVVDSSRPGSAARPESISLSAEEPAPAELGRDSGRAPTRYARLFSELRNRRSG